MNFQLWLPVLALLLGSILHSLSDDGGANALTHFGITGKLPPAVLPVAILVFGVGSGTLDSVVAGSGWEHAVATALAAAIATVFGATATHAMVNKTAAFLIVVAIALPVSACGFLSSPEAKVVENAAFCILEHSTEPPKQILVDCAGTTLEQIETTIAKSDKSAADRAASRDAGRLDRSDPWGDAADAGDAGDARPAAPKSYGR